MSILSTLSIYIVFCLWRINKSQLGFTYYFFVSNSILVHVYPCFKIYQTNFLSILKMLRCKCLFLYFSTKVPCDWFVSEFLNIHLAFIKAYENMLMLITVQIDDRQIKSSFWIGGTDFIVDGQWVWISTQKNLTYSDWGHH